MNRAYGWIFVGKDNGGRCVDKRGHGEGVGKKKRKGVEPEEGHGLGAPPISTGEDHLADCPRASVSPSGEWGWVRPLHTHCIL